MLSWNERDHAVPAAEGVSVYELFMVILLGERVRGDRVWPSWNSTVACFRVSRKGSKVIHRKPGWPLPEHEASFACRTLVDITISSSGVLLRPSFPAAERGMVVLAVGWFQTGKVPSKESEGPGKARHRASCRRLQRVRSGKSHGKRTAIRLKRRIHGGTPTTLGLPRAHLLGVCPKTLPSKKSFGPEYVGVSIFS